jgi:pimeloyl-ACP methyl ester carboxylesterase
MSQNIVMIHGMFCGGWVWEGYKRLFESRGYACIAPTLRYHDTPPGDPPHPRLGTTSLLDYASDIEAEIRELDTLPVILGHSMGGLLAQILGSRGLAQALVLLAPAAPRGIMPLRYTVIRSVIGQAINYGFWKKPILPTFKNTVYSSLHLLPPERQREIFGRFVPESGRAAWEIGFTLLDENRASEVDEAKISCPILVAVGTKDRLTPPSVVKKIADKYGRVSTYRAFADHAHWIVGEPGWEEIAAFIQDWLDLPRGARGQTA